MSRTKVDFKRLYLKNKIKMMMEKYYAIERAAEALAKFPGQKSDLKDFT